LRLLAKFKEGVIQQDEGRLSQHFEKRQLFRGTPAHQDLTSKWFIQDCFRDILRLARVKEINPLDGCWCSM
jgi:hypothetical protein